MYKINNHFHNNISTKIDKKWYLGVTLTTDLKNKNHLEARRRNMIIKFHQIRTAGIDSDCKYIENL